MEISNGYWKIKIQIKQWKIIQEETRELWNRQNEELDGCFAIHKEEINTSHEGKYKPSPK